MNIPAALKISIIAVASTICVYEKYSSTRSLACAGLPSKPDSQGRGALGVFQ